jgi:hypothetical protein
MKRVLIAGGLVVAVALMLTGLVAAADSVKSGPQVGQEVPGPFHPLNVTGAKAGQKNCLFCQNGQNPVAMIFAREVNEPLTKLIKKLDEATAQHSDCSMGSFVVFLSDAEDLQARLKDVAEKEGIKNIVLSIDNPAGPDAYKVSKDADVTVVLYNQHKVKANFAFKKDELKEKDIDVIVADITKIIPEK